MSYKFAGQLYPTERSMLNAIAEQWLSCDGLTSEDEQRSILGETDDSALARECIKGWELDQPGPEWPADEASRSHMDEHGYGTLDVANAFTRLRKRLQTASDNA